VTDRAEELRRTAARCLVLAQKTSDPPTRAALSLIAQRLYDLATNRPLLDFDAMVKGYNDRRASGSPPARPVLQQQQQIQSQKDE
jgi:hypothetical protein